MQRMVLVLVEVVPQILGPRPVLCLLVLSSQEVVVDVFTPAQEVPEVLVLRMESTELLAVAVMLEEVVVLSPRVELVVVVARQVVRGLEEIQTTTEVAEEVLDTMEEVVVTCLVAEVGRVTRRVPRPPSLVGIKMVMAQSL